MLSHISQTQITFAELTATHLFIWRGVLGVGELEKSHICMTDVEGVFGSEMYDIDRLQACLQIIQSKWKEFHSSPLHAIDYLCVSPQALMSLRTRGMTEIRQGRVAAYEMDEVYSSATHIGLPEGYVLQYVQPLWYEIDKHLRVIDPLGLAGKRLEGQFHLVALPGYVIQTLKAAFKKAGVAIGGFVVKPLILPYETWVSPAACDQKLLISLEQDQCQIALLERNVCRFVSSHCMSESLMDRDLVACLNMTLAEAKKIRSDLPSLSGSQLIRRQSTGYDLQLVAEILQARAYEMSEEIYQMLINHVRWELPLSIEVRSQDAEHYMRPWLQRFFSKAEIHFYSADSQSSSEWLSFEALSAYLLAQNSIKRYKVDGWRGWWNKCKNWIEYHL